MFILKNYTLIILIIILSDFNSKFKYLNNYVYILRYIILKFWLSYFHIFKVLL